MTCKRIVRACLLAFVAAFAASGPALASSLSYEGDALVMHAAPGEQNFVVVDETEGRMTFTDDYPIQFPAGRCSQDDPEYPVSCDLPSGRVRLDLGDGNDNASFGFEIPTNLAFEFDGGPGNDILKGPRNGIGSATLDGGDGNDQITSEDTPDTLVGGAGDDTLTGGANTDVLLGGPGNDKLRGDDPSGAWADVLDGGDGIDELLDDYTTSAQDAAHADPVDILLDGVANDGRPGEGDNITGVEDFDVGAVKTFLGDGADNTFYAPETGGPASISGGGGNDQLFAGDASGDHVDGGPGDDTVSGGMGNDTLVGGPGRDDISGDRPARCNELHCDFMDGYGDDTIDARDGEVDHVQCGPGKDTVYADAIDVVTDDCETVNGAAGASHGQSGAGGSADSGRGSASSHGAHRAIALVGPHRLRDVLRHGLRIRLADRRHRVTARALLHSRVVARGAGRGTIRLRLTRSGRRALRHAKRAVLRVVAGHAHVTVRLTR